MDAQAREHRDTLRKILEDLGIDDLKAALEAAAPLGDLDPAELLGPRGPGVVRVAIAYIEAASMLQDEHEALVRRVRRALDAIDEPARVALVRPVEARSRLEEAILTARHALDSMSRS